LGEARPAVAKRRSSSMPERRGRLRVASALGTGARRCWAGGGRPSRSCSCRRSAANWLPRGVIEAVRRGSLPHDAHRRPLLRPRPRGLPARRFADAAEDVERTRGAAGPGADQEAASGYCKLFWCTGQSKNEPRTFGRRGGRHRGFEGPPGYLLCISREIMGKSHRSILAPRSSG